MARLPPHSVVNARAGSFWCVFRSRKRVGEKLRNDENFSSAAEFIMRSVNSRQSTPKHVYVWPPARRACMFFGRLMSPQVMADEVEHFFVVKPTAAPYLHMHCDNAGPKQDVEATRKKLCGVWVGSPEVIRDYADFANRVK